MQYVSETPQWHLVSLLVDYYMHDAMIKILELFIKLIYFYHTNKTTKQVESTKVSKRMLKTFSTCYSTERFYFEQKQQELLKNKFYNYF
jgi:hypothetical protein